MGADLSLDEVAERLMRMDPTRPGVGRLAQELVAELKGLLIEPVRAHLVPWHPGSTGRRMIARVMATGPDSSPVIRASRWVPSHY